MHKYHANVIISASTTDDVLNDCPAVISVRWGVGVGGGEQFGLSAQRTLIVHFVSLSTNYGLTRMLTCPIMSLFLFTVLL